MTAGYNVFKDNSPSDKPDVHGVAVSAANLGTEHDISYMRADGRFANSTANVPNVVRGHHVNGGSKDGD